MSVGSAEAARWLAPALAPAGLAVRSGGNAAARGTGPLIAGTPPSNVPHAADVKLEPGSVISIPLAWGDLDLNASGTVTEVRPDGTVLAFGHAMNAVGDTRLPVATGYTHFVVSRTSISFKQSGSIGLVGTLVRDEQSAVAARPLRPGEDGEDLAAFDAAPVAVHIEMPGQPARDYDFMVVDDPSMTGGVLAAVVIQALTAVQDLPVEHTLRVKGTLKFSGDRTLPLDAEMPQGGARGIAFNILPYVNAMMQNNFASLELEGADLSVVVEEGIRELVVQSATLDRANAHPGDTVTVAVALSRYQQARGHPFHRTEAPVGSGGGRVRRDDHRRRRSPGPHDDVEPRPGAGQTTSTACTGRSPPWRPPTATRCTPPSPGPWRGSP